MAKRDSAEDEMERVAECHCGQLRAITLGEPESVYVCHCKACQRRTGAVIHNGSRWPKSQVRIEGEHKTYGRIADSGFEIRFHFCPNCGELVEPCANSTGFLLSNLPRNGLPEDCRKSPGRSPTALELGEETDSPV